MPLITCIAADGTRTELQANLGTSIMQAALTSGLPGINADCGGACQCATCHVYVDSPWLEQLPAMDDMEDAMLDSTGEPRQVGSRLSCCLLMNEAPDDIVVPIPAAQ